MTDILTPKTAKIFKCEKCLFECCKKSDWYRHLLTLKHINTDILLTNTAYFTQKNADTVNALICKCGKQYKHRQSVFNHKKKCYLSNNNLVDDSNINEKELIMTLLQQNNQLQNHIIELCKEKSITNITNTNSHNKTFNLNMFLNETCKDAMNITDFVNSIKLQLSDLEKVGELGYIEGLSSIIVKNLNALDITLRPVHCIDKKRETMYIKDEDKWEKDDETKVKMHKMIKKVANKNIDLISDFKLLHPDWKKSSSKVSDQFNKIIIESMGGRGDNEYEKEDKIIKKIAKEVLINKTPF
jgi:hypothetical protein